MSQLHSFGMKIISAAALAALLLTGCAVNGQTNRVPTQAPVAGATSQSNLPVTGEVGNPSQPVTLLETGSSLLYPLFNDWASAIQQEYPNITIQTASTGSGTGIAQSTAGVVQIGASDAYMSDAQLANTPGIVNIPLAISAQQINYNLPGVTSLNLSGSVLAGIFTGTIRYWDDPALQADNPGVNLPHNAIVPVHRTDGSGDTFLFTQYLSAADSTWKDSIGYNTSVNWPAVQGALGGQGNPGVLQTLAQTPDSIGYLGISFLDQAQSKGLGTAALKNQAGHFVMPTQTNISAAAAAMVNDTPDDERISLIYAPGVDSYPIINYEYAVVQSHAASPEQAAALRTALMWIISPDGGNASKYLDPVHFLPLPASVFDKSKAQINKIQ